MQFDPGEQSQERNSTSQHSNNRWTSPAHRRISVWLNPIRDADEQKRQADRKSEIAGPIDGLMFTNSRGFTQHQIGPDRSHNAYGDADQEDQPPIEVGENTTQNQTNYRTKNSRDLIDAHCQTALIRRESISKNRGTVRKKKTGTDALDQTKDDEFDRARIASAGS